MKILKLFFYKRRETFYFTAQCFKESPAAPLYSKQLDNIVAVNLASGLLMLLQRLANDGREKYLSSKISHKNINE